MSHRLRTLFVLAAAAVACAGCGLATAAGSGSVSLTITRGFGGLAVGATSSRSVRSGETVGQLLAAEHRVTTGIGRSVQSIGSLADGGGSHWFYFVNGVQGPRHATTTAVHGGDHVWWDLHDASATQSIPAVVGSFPEPFANGIGGKRYPVTVECGSGVAAACRRVTAALDALHVPAAPQLLGTGSGPDTLGVVVGTWSQIRSEVAAELVAYGPGASGVYARFVGSSAPQLQLLNAQGHVVRTLGTGAGLIAATADSSSVPTWMVTGTDVAGVDAAAAAFNAPALHDHFALAVQGSRRLPVPLAAPG